ncbi:hypothetical protein [Polaribacter sp. Asnod1-A03]|uniref:hypothetical protein n=1 Tax=Polaribacter sp. Asnod1-A03 TaxID=3160581 RepID=UPI00386565EC
MKIIILFFALFLLKCASVKTEKEAPFIVESTTYYKGEVKEESSIHIRFTPLEEIKFDSLYLRNKKAKIKIKRKGGLEYIFAEFDKKPIKQDLVLDVNPKKELKNKIPKSQNILFKLKENEAVISYFINEEIAYFKIKEINIYQD